MGKPMRMIVRMATAVAVAVCCAPAASAQIAPTPDAWKPDQAKAKADAYVAGQIAVFTRKAPAGDILLALRLVQMVRPDEPTAISQLAFYLGANKADAVYTDILAIRPDEAVANYYLAEKLSGEGYVNLALPFYAKAIAQRQNDAVVQYNAGMNAFYAGDDAACIAYLTRSLEIGGDSRPVWLKRGECYARAGKKNEARADFGKADTGGAYSVRMFSEGVFDGCRGGSLDNRVRDAAKIADNWKAYEGYRDLTRVLQCNPKHIGALKELLKIEDRDINLTRHAQVHRLQLQNLQDGGATYAARLKMLEVPSPAQMLAEGQAIDMSNDAGGDKRMRAIYLASRVLMIEPHNPQAHLLRARGIANLAIGPLSALAWDDATEALNADPKLATAHFVRAILFVRGNGLNEAVTELTAAIAIDPNDMRFYAQRGDAYAQLQKNEPAVQDLTRFLTSSSKDVPALIGRALAYYNMKNYQAALSDLDVAFSVDPKNFRVKASTVRVLDAMGRKADADAVHIVLLAEYEAETKANAYLSSRATPDIAAKARDVKEGHSYAALQKRAQDRFQAFINEYSPAEYSYENLVRKMGLAKDGDDGQKVIKDLRDTAAYANEHLKDAWRIGTAFAESTDVEGLSEEMIGKLATYLVHVETMQKGMTRIMDALN